MEKKIDLYKCRMACDLMLGALSNSDEHATVKLDYYRELCNLVKEYERLVDENEHLKRDNFGMKQTITNLNAKLEKAYAGLSWNNDYGKHGKRHR